MFMLLDACFVRQESKKEFIK